MRYLVCLYFLFFFYSVSVNANKEPESCYKNLGNISVLDLSLEGCEYNEDMPDAVVIPPLSPNSINGIFGITVPSKIQNYKQSLEPTKSKHFHEILYFNPKYKWFKITPIKKNDNFIDYYVYSPNVNQVTRITAIGLMNKDLCQIANNKIFDLFGSKYKEYYYF